MRNPDRIPYVLEKLAKAWLMKLDLRLGQLLSVNGDPFNVEDYDMLKNVCTYAGVYFDEKADDIPEYFIGDDPWKDLPMTEKLIHMHGLENLTREKMLEMFQWDKLIDMGFCPNDAVKLIKFDPPLDVINMINPDILEDLEDWKREDFGTIESICPVCGFTEGKSGRSNNYEDEIFPI